MKKTILIFGLLLSIVCSCGEDNGFTSAGPISVYLGAKWKLTKIVSTRSVKTESQIGYVEILDIGNDHVRDFENTYRDDKLVETYIWDRQRNAEMSTKNMTILMRYAGNKERFYRILGFNEQNVSLEASAYLEKVGSTQDTVKYYYSLVQ